MITFLSIFKNDLRIVGKDIKALLLLLLMPVIVILIFAKALAPLLEESAFVEPFNIAVVDKEQSMWTGLLSTQLKNLGIIENVYWSDEEQARERVANNEAAAALIIPENLSDSITHWEPEQGKVLGSSALYLESRLIKNIAMVGSTSVSAGLAALNAIYDFEAAAEFEPEYMITDINNANETFISFILARKNIFTETRQEKPDVNPIEFYAASMLAIFIMFSSIPCIKLIAEERRLGILSRIQAAPSKSWQLIGSKLLLSVIISIAQFAIIAVFLSIAAKTQLGNSAALIVLVFLCTTVAAAAFSLLIAAVATSTASTDLVANLSILLMAVVGGSIYPLSSLPDAVKSLSQFTINRWSAEGFVMAISGGQTERVFSSCSMMLFLAAGYFTAALLMMGLRRRRTGV